MIEAAVGHLGLQLVVAQEQAFYVFGAVEMCIATFDDSVNKDHMELAAVPVRVHGVRA